MYYHSSKRYNINRTVKPGKRGVSTAENIDGNKINVKQTLFTWSNFISLSRVFIAFPIVYLHYTNGQQITWRIGLLVLYGIYRPGAPVVLCP